MLLKKFPRTKFKTSTDYLVIFIVINLGIVIMSVASGVFAYKSNLNATNQSLKQEALGAGNIITEIISEHSWQIRLLADKIMKSGGDLKKINRIITSSNEFNVKSNFDQFLNQKDLYWVDQNDDIVIKNRIGILKYPQKASDRYSVFNSRKNSWKLVISEDLPHFRNGYSLILTSFGVTDDKGKYLGSIVSSIDVSFLQNLLIKTLPANGNNVVVLGSRNNKIIFQSNLGHFIKNPEFFTYKIGNIDYNQNQNDHIENDISGHGIKYTYYKKLSEYPLVVLSGYNDHIYKSQLLKLIIRAIYPNIVVGFILLITLFLFYKRIVKPIKNLSEIAKKIGSDNSFDNNKFPKKINSPEIFSLSKALLKIKFQRSKLEKSNNELVETKKQLEEAIDVIKKSDIAQIEIIKQIRKDISKNTTQVFQVLGMLKHNLEGQTSPDTKMNLFLINNLERDITNITKFATDELSKEFLDVQHIINKAVLSQEKEIKIRSIKLEVFYNKNLPKKIFVDQIRLIQILSSILQKTISLLSEENTVKIYVKTTLRDKKKNLLIRIEDDGMGIGFKEHINDAERFGGKEESSVNGIDISVETIEELIALHQGNIIYDNKIQHGSNVTIILPCVKQIKNNSSATSKKVADNIIFFPVRNKDQ